MEKGNSFQILRPKDVQEALNISKSTLQRISKKDSFPSKRYISPRVCGWMESEIKEWLEDQADVSTPEEVAV